MSRAVMRRRLSVRRVNSCPALLNARLLLSPALIVPLPLHCTRSTMVSDLDPIFIRNAHMMSN